jgi:N-acetylglucosamine kinase-like BadF-type ATPase
MTKYLLGIDGGGSKTDFLLCDFELNEIARRVSTRSNPNDVGIEAVKSLIRENIALLLAESGIINGDIAAAFAGIAGLTSRDYAAQVTKTLSDMLPNAKCASLHDGINVLYGAFPFEDGVSVICGTGSSCFVKKGNSIFRIGGYGVFDMSGNGYEIGKAGIAHALETADGRSKEGILEELLHEKLGTDFVRALDILLKMSKDEIASFARTVFDAAEKGDLIALTIIESNMLYIATLINRAADYFEGEFKVALAGGILNNGISLSYLQNAVTDRASLIKSERAPVFGAAAKALTLVK